MVVRSANFVGMNLGLVLWLRGLNGIFQELKGRGVDICGEVAKNVQDAAFLATQGPDRSYKPIAVQSVMSWAMQLQFLRNENANLIEDAERILMEDSDTKQVVGKDGEEINFPSTETGVQIENRTREISQPIQISMIPGRTSVDVQDTGGTAMQTLNLVGRATEISWIEMLAFSKSDAFLSLLRKLMFLEFASREGDNGLRKWESRLLLIHAVLNDREEKQATNLGMKIWLRKLTFLAYGVKDILIESQTKSLQRSLKSAESQASTCIERECLPTSTANQRPRFVAHNKEAQSNLKKKTARPDGISQEKTILELDTNAGEMFNRLFNRASTKEPKVYGWKKDMAVILTRLTHDELRDVPLEWGCRENNSCSTI